MNKKGKVREIKIDRQIDKDRYTEINTEQHKEESSNKKASERE